MLPGSRPGTRLAPQGPLVRGAAFAFDVMLVVATTGTLASGHALAVWRLGLLVLVALFAYFTLAEGCFGATPGKRLFGMRVVRASDGGRCGLRAALVRTALRVVDNLPLSLPGLIAIATSDQCQRYGDRTAGTLVVVELPEDVLRVLHECDPEAPPDLGLEPSDRLVRRDVLWPDTATDQYDQRPQRSLDLDCCPFCEVVVRPDEVVCPHCGQYVNQVTARGEAEGFAPAPLLYASDRRWRFDALWRLAFAGDEESLASISAAMADWSTDERLLAVQAFADVDDPCALAFLELMTRDDDFAVRALARGVRSGLLARISRRAG